jgi:hypothetical protein
MAYSEIRTLVTGFPWRSGSAKSFALLHQFAVGCESDCYSVLLHNGRFVASCGRADKHGSEYQIESHKYSK